MTAIKQEDYLMTKDTPLSDDCEAAYKRGCETTQAAIDKFGLSFAKDALSLNHPRKLKGTFKSNEAYQYTKGCFDTLGKNKKLA